MTILLWILFFKANDTANTQIATPQRCWKQLKNGGTNTSENDFSVDGAVIFMQPTPLYKLWCQKQCKNETNRGFYYGNNLKKTVFYVRP